MGDVLAIDIGGSHVKVRIESDPERRRFESGPDMTAAEMVKGVKKIITDWDIDRVAMGVPADARVRPPPWHGIAPARVPHRVG